MTFICFIFSPFSLLSPPSECGDACERDGVCRVPHAAVAEANCAATAGRTAHTPHTSLPITAMLVLFETPAGYALFKVLDKTKIASAEDVFRHFDTVEHAQQVVKLKAFSKFEDTTSALAAATSICDGKLDKSLKSFLKEAVLKGKEDADKVRPRADRWEAAHRRQMRRRRRAADAPAM